MKNSKKDLVVRKDVWKQNLGDILGIKLCSNIVDLYLFGVGEETCGVVGRL